ncbi:energy-coupling factor ABC transporter ATP-binding protein [Acaricomes phytoseiuli]|uniref:energy-coupling factor ABC transporter ATP-binding protein n=1 Tax=Acaricomes phytoseiuli TaxID=291968 RepID=UPI0003787A48|nr:ABC transporter ATP-binding protein [Acaricomes phytoseiuli]MCW1250268.1 energy-coupling factor ABC transporter ATP-binding protein [Acaricomes phytoseiuli]
MSVRFHAASVSAENPPGTPSAAAQKQILAATSLTLAEARISVIGANGSGKSTLLRLINGLIRPSTGSVTVEGMDTVTQGAAVRRMVGFMFTDPLSQLVMPTPREDLELSLRRSHPQRAERRAAAEHWLSKFGLDAHAEQSVYALSGGERQLVALASVLAVSPRVLVLDEPTTLLDLGNTLRLRRTLEQLSAELQIIVATHDLELAAEADRLLWVCNGGVVYDGPPGPGISQYYQYHREQHTSFAGQEQHRDARA